MLCHENFTTRRGNDARETGVRQAIFRPRKEALVRGLDVIDALKRLFGGAGDLPDQETVAVGLLLEVIRMDDDFDAAERASVGRILTRRFDVNETQIAGMLADAEAKPRITYDDNQLLQAVNTEYSAEQKMSLVEILWEIALADGELHRFENHAILAIANQLGMGQSELDATKSVAKARLAA